jgi:hypothetical protein
MPWAVKSAEMITSMNDIRSYMLHMRWTRCADRAASPPVRVRSGVGRVGWLQLAGWGRSRRGAVRVGLSRVSGAASVIRDVRGPGRAALGAAVSPEKFFPDS